MNDDLLPIGTLTFFVNVPRNDVLTSEEQRYLAEATVSAFRKKLQESEFGNTIVITSVTHRRGCIVISVGLALVIPAVSGIAAGIIQYPKLRTGIIAIAKDINSLKVRLKRWKAEKSVCLMREDLELEVPINRDNRTSQEDDG